MLCLSGFVIHGSVGAQVPPKNVNPIIVTPQVQNNNGNRLFNPYHMEFKRDWEINLDDRAKLIALGPVSDSRKTNLVVLISGNSTGDTQRKIKVMHWNDSRFLLDSELSVQSIGTDTLLLGRFQTANSLNAPVAGQTEKTPKKKKSSISKGVQVLTNAGVYAWSGDLLARLASVPLDVKLSIVQEGRLDQMLVGAGNGTTSFEFVNDELKPSAVEPLDGGGFVSMGVGLQEFNGSDGMTLGANIKYVQSFWRDRNHWMIGLVKGRSAPTPDAPNATTGDRLVIFTPKFSSRDKSFWETRLEDMEETWRGESIAGRVLDVRVGDPKNTGKPGILILTSENEDKLQRLTFFSVSKVG